ncbi:MAG TPA: hypothetical protein VIL48_05510, partial [Acidimicrobiales bacterium]
APPPPEPTTTAPPPTAAPPPPAEPEVGPVVWLPGQDQLQITLANPGGQPTDYLVVVVTLAGGAVSTGLPTGCQLAVPLVLGVGCGVSPVAPGQATVVHVPVTVTGAGQSARVQLCEVALLRADCSADILATTTVPLTE